MLALLLPPEDVGFGVLFTDVVYADEVEGVLVVEIAADEAEDIEDIGEVDGEVEEKVAVVVIGYGSPASG